MNPLQDVLSPKVRKVLYAILFVLAIVFAAYQASDGNYWTMTGSIVTSLLGLLAASNTPAPEE